MTRPQISAQAGRIDWALAALLFLSVWSPADDIGYPELLETLRYLLYPVAAAVFILRRWNHGEVRVDISRTPVLWLCALVAYWCASSIWSDEVLFSLQRSVLLAATFGAVLVAVSRLSVATIASTLMVVLVAYTVTGAVAALAFPSIGLENSFQHAGKWRGLAGQKNTFGLIAALAALVLVSGRGSLPKVLTDHKWLRWLLVAVCLLCVYETQSRGAFVALLIGLTLLAFFSLEVKVRRLGFMIALVSAPLLGLVVLASLSVDNDVVSILGADFDTNNRVPLWSYGFSQWQGRELLGVGFGGFWTVQRTNEFLAIYRWVLPNFHNGYVSILIETGIVGGTIFAACVLSTIYNLVVKPEALAQNGARFFASIFLVVLVYNAVENTLSRSTNILLILFMLGVAVSAARPASKVADAADLPEPAMSPHRA